MTFSDNLTACGRNSEESRWRMIRELDELENWTERNQVVTKGDHVINCESSRVRWRVTCNKTASGMFFVC